MSTDSDLVFVIAQHPVHRGPQFLRWRAGGRYVARRADLTWINQTAAAVFGVGPGSWAGVHHGRCPVVIDDATPVPDGARVWLLHRGQPTPPAPVMSDAAFASALAMGE